MDKIKLAFERVRGDMDKILQEIQQIKDMQGIILDKIGVETIDMDVEEVELDISNDDTDSNTNITEDEISEADEESLDIEEEVLDIEDDESESVEGNFIATKTGKRYHVLTCNLVKNIAEKNRLAFNSSEDAEEEGLMQCHCVKKANN